jgi:lipopolysaccharide export system protein LptA
MTGMRLAAGFAVMLALAGFAAPATADPASAMFTGFQSNSKEPIKVDAGALEIADDGKQRISKFTGGVTIRRGDTTLKAATISLIQDLPAKPAGEKAAPDGQPETVAATKPAPKARGTQSFSRIEASGKVVVSSGAQSATGDKAVFNAAANTVVLAGNVVLRQGESHITGDKLTIDLKSGVARMEQTGGRIKGEFLPSEMQAPDGKRPGKTPVPQPKPDG